MHIKIASLLNKSAGTQIYLSTKHYSLLKANFHNNILTISSESKNEKNKLIENYTHKEFSYQSFQRSFTVHENTVNSDKTEVKYNNGIFNIKLPKREEVKPQPKREIQIS